jgi:Tn3 transposase DDE domain
MQFEPEVVLLATDFVSFARRGEMVSNRPEDHEISMLALHLIQNCMVYINTLMIQKVLAQPHWQGRLTPREHEGFGTLEESKRGKSNLYPGRRKKTTTREVVVFLFLYLNDLYSYFSAAFSDTKSNFFPGKVPVNCKRRLSLGTIADLLRTLQLKSNLYPGWTRKRQR